MPNSPPPSTVVPPSPSIAGLPVSINVKQRSTSVIPGAANELSLTADDVTRGQIMVSVVRNRGETLLGPISMKTGESATFHFGAADYSLKLTELSDALIGEDFASFVISDMNAKTLTEEQKIERLIAAVEVLNDVVFLRNGAEHSPKDAAEHLRRKLEAATNKITSASQFIDHVASSSSITGEDYKIRFADGRTVLASDYLREELQKLESSDQE